VGLWVAWLFDSRSGRGCVATLGKLFTLMFLDADSLGVDASLNIARGIYIIPLPAGAGQTSGEG